MQIYKDLLTDMSYATPHEFVQTVYERYKEQYRSQLTPSTNGRIFEYLICETLAQEGIVPFYYQAKFMYVPNADFDVAMYHPIRPVVLTMKTSLRERYKQAALKGLALERVYRRAENYLITLSVDEAKNIQQKIINNDVLGLNGCIVATSREYDKLLSNLRNRTFRLAEPVIPVSGGFYSERPEE